MRMTVEYGNGWYFFYIILAAAFITALYFILRKLPPKWQKIILVVISLCNLAFHFLKFFGSVYYMTDKGYRELFFITLCSSTIALTPFALLSKSESFKDYVFYIGVSGGFMALLIPTEALGGDPFCFLSVRFYVQHIVLASVPLLCALLNLHRPSYKRIWKMPFWTLFAYCFIIINHVIAYELGFMEAHENFLHARFFNPSLVWGPTDPLAKVLEMFTPNFMKTVPVGEYAGQAKYWPLFWMMPAIFILMWGGPLIYCLLFDFKRIFADCTSFKCRCLLGKELSKSEYIREEQVVAAAASPEDK